MENEVDTIAEKRLPLRRSWHERRLTAPFISIAFEERVFCPTEQLSEMPEPAVFEPWDKALDIEFRLEAFSDIVQTFNKKSHTKQVLRQFSEWQEAVQGRSAVPVHPTDETALFGLMEEGLTCYSRLQQERYGSRERLFDKAPSPLRPCEADAFVNTAIAHDILVMSSLGLVRFLARKYGKSYDNAGDFFQAGVIGLMTEVRKHGVHSDAAFSPYWAIRAAISAQDREEQVSIGMTASQFNQWKTVQRSYQRLHQEKSMAATPEAIADDTGMSLKSVKRLMQIRSSTPLSLDQPIGEDGDVSIGDIIADRKASIEEESAHEMHMQKLHTAFNEKVLDDQERFILGLRYGFTSAPGGVDLSYVGQYGAMSYQAVAAEHLVGTCRHGLSLDEISAIIGVQRQQVKKLFDRAQHIVRARLEAL